MNSSSVNRKARSKIFRDAFFWRAALHRTDGVTSLEYALLAGAIFAVIVASVGQVGSATGALFDTVARLVSN